MGAQPSPVTNQRQALLIDADDTLWENNLYFKQAIAEFEQLLTPLLLPRETLVRELNRVEERNIRQRGYGARRFVASLEETYRNLAGPKTDAAVVAKIRRLIDHVLFQETHLYPGVRETLAYLSPRHRLRLLTKGDPEEQARKVKLSRLLHFFEDFDILPEKDTGAFRRLAEQLELPPTSTWVVGNSPRSDINPALAAGLNAVYIPSPHTWELEKEDIRASSGRLLVLESFARLRDYF